MEDLDVSCGFCSIRDRLRRTSRISCKVQKDGSAEDVGAIGKASIRGLFLRRDDSRKTVVGISSKGGEK